MCSPVQTSVPFCMVPKEVDVARSSSHRGSGPTCHTPCSHSCWVLEVSSQEDGQKVTVVQAHSQVYIFPVYQDYDPRWHFIPGIYLAVLMSNSGEAC